MKLLARVLRYLVAVGMLLAIVGAAYQLIASSRDAERFPMPGERIDIGGRVAAPVLLR